MGKRVVSEKREFAQHFDLMPDQERTFETKDLAMKFQSLWRFNGILKNVQIKVTYYLEEDKHNS